LISDLEIVIRLVAAAVIAGIIGLEREINNRPAGLRTHMLVAIGSSLMMLVSKYGFLEFNNADPSRLAAQVVSGIGFLGAGTIIMSERTVHGLTTAASLWATACIGLATGAGYYVGAAIGSILVIFTLVILLVAEKTVLKYKYKNIKIDAVERLGLINDLGEVFKKYSLHIKNMKVETKESLSGDEEVIQEIRIVLDLPDWTGGSVLLAEIHGIDGVIQAEWV
jgi:putative Mg2+ transporter-C (MgtC) family protein